MKYSYAYFTKLYNDNYKKVTFDKKGKLRIARFKKISSFIKEGEKVLDFGGGDGDLKTYLPKCDYTILDLSKEHKLQKFKKVALKDDIYITNPDSSYDVVVMSEVLEHIPNTYETLGEVNRVLKKNGKLIITVPNPFSLLFCLRALFGYHLDPSREHLYWYDWSYLSNLLYAAGFSLQYKTTFSFILSRLYEKIYFIDPLLMIFFKNSGIQLFCVFEKIKSTPRQH